MVKHVARRMIPSVLLFTPCEKPFLDVIADESKLFIEGGHVAAVYQRLEQPAPPCTRFFQAPYGDGHRSPSPVKALDSAQARALEIKIAASKQGVLQSIP